VTALAVCVAAVQLFFAATWTLYVIYLPQLVQRAGIEPAWVPWLLVADQLVFAAMDVATGFWIDRVRAGVQRLGGWILGVAVLSCLAFVLLPFAGASAPLLLGAIAVWAVTSSALRSPPWALLSRHAATPALPWLSTIVLTGTAIASVVAPYLGLALRGVDPRLPFLASTAALVAAVGVLMLAEKRMGATARGEATPVRPLKSAPYFAALMLLAMGFQVHFSLNSPARYLQFAPREALPYLVPVFWLGFNVLMFPAARVVKRLGERDTMAIAASLGALAMLACVLATSLPALVAAQFLAGGGWGVASVAAYSAAVALGRTGREGRFLGSLFAVLAVATALRLALAGAMAQSSGAFSAVQPWLPETLWLTAALLLVAGRLRREDPRRPA